MPPFLRQLSPDRRPELISRLFVGRLTLTDIFELEPLFEENLIGAPKYIPPWAANVRYLAAFLAFSGVVNAISLRDIALESIHTQPRAPEPSSAAFEDAAVAAAAAGFAEAAGVA